MRHYAFVTTELSPFTPGGAGVLVATTVSHLRNRGDRVSVVLCADVGDTPDDPNVFVSRPAIAPGWDFGFMDLSMGAAETLADLHAEAPIDEVEIQDFDGLAFWTLTHRRDLGLGNVPISVRLHGPVDLQVEAMGGTTHEFDVVSQMERESFRMADRVVAPSSGMAQLATTRYDLDPDRVVVGPPAVRTTDPNTRWAPGGTSFVVVGRLSEVKGSHDFVEAVVPVLREFPDTAVTFVGGDGWSMSTNQPMSTHVRSLIPEDVSDRFTFVSHSEPDQVDELMASSLAVVVPSRFESFNLAAHEARALGAPVVAPSIAAFTGPEFDGTGIRWYDGTKPDLSRILAEIASDPAALADTASQPAPPIGDPLVVYRPPGAEVRHERSQGGVGTAALARVEAVRFDPSAVPAEESLIRKVLARTPTRLIDAMKPLVPRSMKDRIKSSSGWDGLVDSRHWEERWTAIESESQAGAWQLPGDPRVSVVVPCFNQGEYLKQAIISVFEQTFDDFEIIVVDDGSDDQATIDAIDGIELDRVRTIRQPNAGLPAARNAGIRSARGEFVVTLDADDLLAESYVETLIDALDQKPDAAYSHCWAELFGDFHSIWATRPPNPFQLLMSNSVVGCVTLRKSAWEAVSGYDESMRSGNEDWDLWIRLQDAGYDNVQIREPLFRYRKHGVSMSVETEGQYEDAINDLSSRLPGIYNHAYLSTLKAGHYPLVSVLTTEESHSFVASTGSDFQRIDVNRRDAADGAWEAKGKYIVLWPEGTVSAVGAIRDLCLILEGDDELGAASTASDDPIVVVRAWSLFDRSAPSRMAMTRIQGTARTRLSIGQFPDDRWSVPDQIDGIPVLRQRPEEVGMIPEWVRG